MAMTKSDKIWMNGKWIAWDDAKIHVLSHVVHYGSSVFEGIRCYRTAQRPGDLPARGSHRPAVLLGPRLPHGDSVHARSRSDDGVRRGGGAQSASMSATSGRWSTAATTTLGVDPTGTPIEVAIAAYPWGKYLGNDALNKGVAVKVGTWARMAPNTLPAMAKAGGNYLNSQLLRLEANADGYAEAIALDVHGYDQRGQRREPVHGLQGRIADAAAGTPASCSASPATRSSRWPANWAIACAR